MKPSLFKAAFAIAAMSLTLSAQAQEKASKSMDMGSMKMNCKGMENMKGMGDMNMKDMKMDCMEGGSASAGAMSDGEVKSVDKAGKTITLKHGPIKSKTVEMGPMTMAFAVRDPALLSKVKAGDKVKFVVENIDNAATVTALNVQK